MRELGAHHDDAHRVVASAPARSGSTSSSGSARAAPRLRTRPRAGGVESQMVADAAEAVALVAPTCAGRRGAREGQPGARPRASSPTAAREPRPSCGGRRS